MKKNEMMKRVFSFLLAMVMLLSAVPMGAISARAMDPQVRVADEATHTSWKQFFNLEELSTENAGMVWTDKSVFTTLPGELTGLEDLDSSGTTSIDFNPGKGDNFLVSLSAMASNKTITGYSTIPTDTMLVLDVSGSMKNNGCYDDMVGAANAAIQRLQEINNNNRVGVVLYSGNSSTGDSGTSTATVLLPLGRYTTTEVKNNQKVYLNYSTGETPTVSINNKVRIEGTVNSPTAQSKKVEGGTYIQNGLYKAMNALLAANPVVEDGKIQAGTIRMPILVLMSDGAPTAATASYMEPQTSHMGNGSGSHTNNAIGFVTQLTAAYAKAKVAQHYGREAMFYTLGLGMNDMTDTEKTVAAHVLNPGQYMHDTATDAYDRYWSSYNALSGSQTMEIEWQQPSGNRTQKKTAKIAKADIAIKQDYVNDFFKAESSQGVSLGQALINAFGKIVDEIILQSRYTPTLVPSGLLDLDGYVSFVDHIGEHMEVTDIKGMVIADHFYSGAAFAHQLKNSGFGTVDNPSEVGDEFVRSIKARLGIESTTTAQALIRQAYDHGQISYTNSKEFSNYIGWYSNADGNFVGFWHEGIETDAPGNATHINKSYAFLGEADPDHGVQQTDMMYTTVRIREEIATGDVTLAWAIPASLIPTLTYEVKLKGQSYDSDLDSITTTGAKAPIRLIYEVELDEEIHDYNIHEIVQGVGGHKDHYNEETGEYTFYSNDWNAQNVESNVNTYAYFEASKENEYYYYISDTVVYDKDGKAVSASTDFKDDQYYYHEYYVYTEDGTRKDLIRIAPSALKDAKKDGNNWVIPKGTAYQLLTNRTRTKNNNEPNSGTLEYIVWPVVDKTPDVQYHTAAVLGNNGKLVVKPTTGIKVTKAVTETVAGASNTFTFIISGGTGNANLVRPGANDDGTDATETLTFTEGKAEFTIDAGKTVYITGLQANTEYTITEKGNHHYAVETVNGKKQDAAVVTLENYEMASVDFVNAPKGYGNLNITKEITSAENYTVPANILNKEFNLTVTMAGLANQTFQVKHSRLESLETVTTDGEGKFTVALMNRDTFQVLDIPENTVVTVAEPAPGENFTVTYRSRNYTGENADEDGQVTIGKDVNSTVVVMNRYAPKSTTVDLDIKGTKIFNNETGKEQTFTFKVQKRNGTAWEYIKDKDGNDLTGSVSYIVDDSDKEKEFAIDNILAGITYDKPGEYAYQVVEVIPEDRADGIIYDRATHTITVKVEDINGQLTASVSTHNAAITPDNNKTFVVNPVFRNYYHYDIVSIDLEKILDNDSGSDKVNLSGYEFVLMDGNNVVAREYSDAVGEARMALTYDSAIEPGVYTHTYTLKEIKPTANPIPNMQYTSTVYTIKVEVTVDNNHAVSAEIVSISGERNAEEKEPEINAVKDNAKVYFANIYTPTSTTLNLAAKKALTGRNLTAEDEGKFQFAIFKDGETSNPVATGTNGANGNITFQHTSNEEGEFALSFDQVGTFKFDVREVIPTAEEKLGGVTYDATIYDLVVEVTDNGGELKATYFYEDATGTVVTFTNRYNAAPTTLTLGGKKTLTDRNLLAGEFKFQLKNAAGEVLQTVENAGYNAGGVFNFAPITYTAEGTYTYTISEVKGNLTGVKYDETVHTVTVKVTDNGAGKLIAKIGDLEVTEKKDYNFTNIFTPQEISHPLSGTKTLTGRKLEEGAFVFVLTDKNDKFIESVNNDADGNFSFSALTFDRSGTYEYKVYEMPGFEDGMTYDKTVYDVKIVVTYNQNEGVFNKEVTISGNGNLVFNNAYVAPAHVTIAGNKTLTNPKGEAVNFNAGNFSFVLANAANETMETVSNDASGNFTFSQLTFWHAGDYEYHITEQKGKDSSVIYDNTLYHVHVHVEPNPEGTALVATSTIGIPSQEDTHVESLTFRNKTREPVQVHLEASKILEGKALTGGEFTFTAVGNNQSLTATNDANGKVAFETLRFDKAGTYTYTITETVGSDAYVKYDTAAIIATVVVTAPENNGPFQATVTYSKTPVFTNKPSNAPGSFSFMKVDEQGHPLAGATFSLHHVNCGNCQQQIGPFNPTSYENGVVTFSEIPTGHQYLLKEDSAPSGYKKTYDRPVTDIYGKFYIEGELTEANNLFKIANVKADATEVLLKGRKILVNTQDQNVVPENNTYTFELLNAKEESIETQRNIATAEGGQAYSEFFFKSIPLTAIGEYTYYIREVQNSANTDVIYDTTLYKVVVKVDQEKDSLQVKSVNYYSGTDFDNCENAVSGVSFTNQLRKDAEVTLRAVKRLEGKTLEAGAYTFHLKDETGKIIQTKTNAANGGIVFDALTYGDVGTYHYTIEEQNGGDPYTTYDSRIIPVTVTVDVGEGDHANAYVADVAYTDAAGSVIEPEFHNIFSDRGEASLNLVKIDELNEPLEGVEFTLTHNCGETCTVSIDPIKATSRYTGVVILEHIPSGHTYTLSETKVPENYTKVADRTVRVSFGKVYIDGSDQPLTSALTIVNYFQGKAAIQGVKNLEGRALKEGEFKFNLYKQVTTADGEVNYELVQTVANAANGTFVFDAIEYGAEGTYKYVVEEVQGDLQGVVYDSTRYEVTVEVTQDEKGELIPKFSYAVLPAVTTFALRANDGNVVFSEALEFTNEYTPDPGKVTLSGTKKLTGKELAADAYTFVLTDKDGQVVDSVKNAADGTFSFDELTFEEIGTYEYKVYETPGDEAGMTYDRTIYDVKVVVTYNHDKGVFESAVTISGNGTLTFNNAYVAPATVNIAGTKTLTGRNLQANEFTFVLTNANNEVLETVKNDTDGKFAFSKLTFWNAGDYEYHVYERKGEDSSVIYDNTLYHVHVHVKHNDDRTALEATYTIGLPAQGGTQVETLTFHNKTREPVQVHLEASKILEGKALTGGEFTFTAVGNNQSLTATNDANGKVAFETLRFDKAGTYTYTITETAGSDAYVMYDTAAITATVVVTAPENNGPFQATVTYSKTPVFTNKPSNAPGSFSFMKVDEQDEPVTENVEFTLTHVKCSDCGMEEGKTFTAKPNEEGIVTFSGIPTGHQYELTETQKPDKYKTAKTRHVTDIYGKFYIDGVEAVDGENMIKIVNVAVGHAELILKGTKYLKDGEENVAVPNGAFQFDLYVEGQEDPIQTQTNMATAEHGSVRSEFIFNAIVLENKGTYTYLIKERPGTDTDMVYTDTEYLVEVIVDHNKNQDLEIIGIKVNNNVVNPVDGVYHLEDVITFTNHLRAEAQVTLAATKVLEGKDLTDGAYTFYLKDETGKIIQTKTNAANGGIVFDALTYGDVGTYRYTIEEQNGGDPYTTYDSRIIPVTVTVDVGEGDHADAYVANVVYTDAAGSVIQPEFHNIFSDRGVVSLELKKINENKEALEGAEFTLTHNCGETCTVSIAPIKATSNEEGEVLLYQIPSGHTYILSESIVPAHYAKVADRTVRVSFGKVYIDDNETALESALTIVNYYQGQTGIRGIKKLEGRALKEGEFEFALYQADESFNAAESPMETVKNGADGSFSFETIEYKTVGTYYYVVKEVKGKLKGITYDETVYHVTVTVTEDEKGELIPKIECAAVKPVTTLALRGNNGNIIFSDILEFNNVFTPNPATVKLEGTKELIGRQLSEGEFTFNLVDADGDLLQTATNNADGKFTFEKLEFHEPGTYEYQISEDQNNPLENVLYDAMVYDVTIVVTKDPVSGELSSVGTIENGDSLAFQNTYEPDAIPAVVKGKKTLEGRDLRDGEFEFILKPEDKALSAITRNDADGNFSFSLSFSKPGEYKYRMYENAGAVPGVTYDDTIYYFIAQVSADPVTGKLNTEIVFTDKDYQSQEDVSEIVFANTYNPAATNITVEARKELTGRAMREGEFEFILTQEGNPLSKLSTNDAEGKAKFSLIFNDAGEYHYTLSENKGSDENVTYDETKYYFTVVVTDTGNGTLETQIVYTDETREAEKYVEEMVFHNTFTPDPITVKLEGSKELIGRKLADKEFYFQLADEDNKTLQTVWNNADGFAFGELEFKTAGTYKYTVSEVKGDLENVVYDTTVYNVTVEVTKDATTGVLSSKVTIDKGGELAFTNTYEPDAIPVVIEGRKNLTGRNMQEGEFEFILKPEDKALSAITRNHADGSFDFHLSFSETGEYKYHLYEKQGSAPGVEYDDTDYYFIVKVTADPATGNLQSEIIFTDAEYNAEKHVPEIVFENTYDPDATNLVVEATKELTGRDMKAGEFEFVLTREDSPLSAMTTNDEDGKIDFNLIFHEAGEYYYTLSEKAGSDPNMTYDDTEYYFTVVVTDSGNGTLDTQIVFTDETRTAEIHVEKMLFQNTYTPDPAVVALKGIKTLTGKNLEKDEFSFQLMNEEGNVLQTVKNGADGKFAFEELKFETTGTYKYTVSEIDENQEGMVYDTTVYNVTVVVTKDAATGVLSAEVTIDNGGKLTFTNTYDPDAVPVVIKGKKVLIGRPMIAGEFKFILTQNGNPVPAVAWNDAFGNFGFNLVFSEPGEYHYTVRELNGGATGMTYDNAVYYFTVIVTDSGDGKLESEIIFTDATRTHVVNVNKMVFRNSYKPNPTSVKLEGTKTLVGRTLKQGEFTFQLKDQAGNVLQTVKNAADGTISFADLEYRGVGVYTYTVTEVKGDDETITYDETVYTATVVVTDYNGNLRAVVTIDNGGELAFTNTYEPEPTEPEPTEPEPTEPEPTEPEPTEPEPTEPEPTEPEPTEPEPTEPEPTEPEPTEPEPTEPEPTEPEPTEPEPTEPEPTEPEPTKPEPTEPETTKPGYDDVPSTRDNNKVLLWAMLAGFAMIGMLAVNPFKKKGRYCR